ncbi:MAG: box helicase [Sphingomonadales bacterium]|nr:box helicase [Sphingomonadales bacterium]
MAEHLVEANLFYVATDEQKAQSVAAAVRIAAPEAEIVFIPSSDALPGEDAPASPANAGTRVAALRRLYRATEGGKRVACIVSAEATARLYPDRETFGVAPPVLRVGDKAEATALSEKFAEIGYVTDDRVDEPGEVAVRGEVIDVFPADASLPARIEFDGETITAIRSYDPMSQRSVADLDGIEVGRANEPPIDDGVNLLEHLEPGAVVIEDGADKRRTQFVALANDAARHGRTRAAVVDDKAWQSALGKWSMLDWGSDGAEALPRFVERKSPLAAFTRIVKPALADGGRLVLIGSARDLRFLRVRLGKTFGCDVEAVESWAAASALPAGSIATLEMPADAGFKIDDMIVASAADLLGSRADIIGQTAASATGHFDSISEFRVGDVIVHEDFGIGVLTGIEAIPGQDGDAIVLEYASEARRLVPVDAADRIWRYGADADAVTLDKLDGSTWEKRRGAIEATIAESARGLTALAKEREARTAVPIEVDAAAYEKIVAAFPFTETMDQSRAIAAVRSDLERGRPMDRLVIGDVGYGKTEVALRAAALVALSGQQVVIAAPTTVLVRQHLEGFRARFEGSGITVAGLSRLSSAAEKKAVIAGLADGSIHIVIGTGAVAGKTVAYRSLGLVIIDEEQKFGNADKTKLRTLHDCHMLTMSATPIPRTLQTALVGLQELSIIATPPGRRQPIRTTVDSWDDTRVRTALLREKGRKGQSFVVVPRIEDMAGVREKLARVVPEVEVVEAHGKMPANELDEAMVGFADGKGDVLLATNIIEAGLDVPRANTMIVWRADRFGLSQLHQLRGRVGRGSRRGQILLLTDAEHPVAERTLQRLKTLQAFDRLGAGFAISARDLDMRGAGDLLGDDQAGHMKLIGIDLYQHLLGSALRAARGENVERWSPELNVEMAGSIPAEWVPDVDIRVALYVRLARIEDEAGLVAFEEELEDRFGALPDDAQRLMAVARVRCLARDARVARIDAGPAAIALTPRRDFAGDVAAMGLKESKGRLILAERIEDGVQRLERVRALLETLVEQPVTSLAAVASPSNRASAEVSSRAVA